MTEGPPEEYNIEDYIAAQNEVIRKAFEDEETKDDDVEVPPTT